MSSSRTVNSKLFQNTLSIGSSISENTDPTSSGIGETTSIGGQFRYPNATAKWSGQIILSGGMFTLDLTALIDAYLGAVTMTGLKLMHWQMVADTANTAAITAQSGATNGYTGLKGHFNLSANDNGAIGPINSGVAVDSTHKTIDFASSMGAAKAILVMLFG